MCAEPRDLTDETVAERVFALAPMGLVISTLEDARFIDVNQRFCEISGWEHDEIIGKSAAELGMWPDAKDRERLLRSLESGAGRVDNMEATFQRKGGELRRGRLNAELVELRGQRCLVVAMLDVTDVWQTAKALRTSQQNFMVLADAMPDVALILNEDGKYVDVFASNPAEQLLAKRSHDLKGKTLHEILSKELADTFLGVVRATLDTGKGQIHRYYMDVPAGVRWFEGRTAVLAVTPGDKGEVLWIAHDISDRMQANLELEQVAEQRKKLAQSLLDAQEEERARISRELHDDLGQILTALKLGCRQLISGMDPSTEEAQNAQRLADHLTNAMDSVRNLSRGLRPRLLDDLGFRPAVEALLAGMSDFECDLRVDGQVDTLPTDARLALFRIVQEALTNAARHANAGLVKVSVRADSPGCIRVTIEDDGVGIGGDALTAAGSIGLTGMRERAALIGAELTIRNRSSSGTIVEAVLEI